MEAVFKALADPTRRRILQLLRTRAMTAGEIASRFTLAKATLSGHFSVLRAADLIDAEKKGSTIIYRLNISVLQEALLEFAEAFGIGQRSGARRRSTEEAG